MEEFHKPETIASRFGMSLQALYAACRLNQIPHVRIGKRIRFPESALQKWIKEESAKSTNGTSLTKS
jgi:excisionase family DNA binding protein